MIIIVQKHLQRHERDVENGNSNKTSHVINGSSMATQLTRVSQYSRLNIQSTSLKLPLKYRLPLIVQILRTKDERQATRVNLGGIAEYPNHSGPSSATNDLDCLDFLSRCGMLQILPLPRTFSHVQGARKVLFVNLVNEASKNVRNLYCGYKAGDRIGDGS